MSRGSWYYYVSLAIICFVQIVWGLCRGCIMIICSSSSAPTPPTGFLTCINPFSLHPSNYFELKSHLPQTGENINRCLEKSVAQWLIDLQWWWINPDWPACLSVIKVDEARAGFRPAGWDSHYFSRYFLLLSSPTSIYNTALLLRLLSLFPKPSAHQIPLLDLYIPYFSVPLSLSLSLLFCLSPFSLPLSPLDI